MTALIMTLFFLIQPATFNERFSVWRGQSGIWSAGTTTPYCHDFGAKPTNCREFI